MRGKSKQHVVDSIQGKKKNSLSTLYSLLSTINPATIYRNMSSPLVGDLSLFSEGFRTSRNDKVQVFYCRRNKRNSLSTVCCLLSTKSGFTLVELLITMAVFVFVIAAATSLFVPLLTQFKQQSKIAETNIEGVIGLEMLRQDLEHAGYGLPWNIPSGTTYTEASSTTPCGSVDPSAYNDSTTNPPRAVVSGNGNCTNSSDYLVIKAVNIATNASSSKWTELVYSSSACASPFSTFAANVCKRCWTSTCTSADDLTSSDLVTVIFPGTTSSTERLLKANSGAYNATSFTTSGIDSSWLPTSATDNIRLVYGLSSGSNAPKRPFNRADYYIRPLTTDELPRCATGTGVLEKATMDYGGGFTQLPLLDCVADMQVIYQLDMNDDGTIGTQSNADGSSVAGSEGATAATVQATLASASLLRNRLKEVRVYILAHEGQRDTNYTSASSITVGEFGLGSTVSIGTNWMNYRWKVYTLVVKPMDLNK